jgi:hypothetical protein
MEASSLRYPAKVGYGIQTVDGLFISSTETKHDEIIQLLGAEWEPNHKSDNLIGVHTSSSC